VIKVQQTVCSKGAEVFQHNGERQLQSFRSTLGQTDNFLIRVFRDREKLFVRRMPIGLEQCVPGFLATMALDNVVTKKFENDTNKLLGYSIPDCDQLAMRLARLRSLSLRYFLRRRMLSGVTSTSSSSSMNSSACSRLRSINGVS